MCSPCKNTPPTVALFLNKSLDGEIEVAMQRATCISTHFREDWSTRVG